MQILKTVVNRNMGSDYIYIYIYIYIFEEKTITLALVDVIHNHLKSGVH